MYSSDKAAGLTLATATGSGFVLLTYPNVIAFTFFLMSLFATVSAFWIARKEKLATAENRKVTLRALDAIQINQISERMAQADLAEMVKRLIGTETKESE